MRFHRFLLMVAVVLPVYTASHIPAIADTLPTPEGRVLLTIEGAIKHTNASGRAEFDYDMLAALGLVSVTDTVVTETGTRFEGVLAKKLMAYVGAFGTVAEAVAVNDYRVEVPMTDLTGDGTVFALSKDGKKMSLRDRGPVWLLYESGKVDDVAITLQQARSIWQLRTLSILE